MANPDKTSQSNSLPEFGNPLLQASFDDPKKKQDPKYGQKILSTIFKNQQTNTTFFWGGRSVRWLENWAWAMGRQNMNEFTDFTNIDGNKSFVNIDMTQNRTGPQFVETLVNSMSQNQEYACVEAIDDGSKKKKDQRKKDALFRMHDLDTVTAAQQQAGINMEPPDAYVPDDELSAEVHFKLKDRLPEEIEFEQGLEKFQHDNEYPTLTRRVDRDLIVTNFAAVKLEKLDNGFIAARKGVPMNMVYNFFLRDSGKMELSYIGELYTLKIIDLRRKYGRSDRNPRGLTEKDIFDIANTASQYNNANRAFYYWMDSYQYQSDRPYDDFGVQVFDCEVKMFDSDYYVSKKDSYGKENIREKKGIPTPQSPDAQVIKTDKYTVYRGIWAVKADKMIYWGLPDLVIKPYMDISESFFSWSVQIPNNDGDYIPSLFERALDPIRRKQLIVLKLKQLIANMVPSGYSIDVETARDIFNGEGKAVGWEEIVRMRNQSGVVLWSSKGLNPNDTNREPPIIEMANAGSVAQLNEIVNIIANCDQEIRQLLGVPMYRDGSDLAPRMGQAVVENQEANANNVTDFINHARKTLMQEVLHKVCIMNWDKVVIQDGRTDLMDTVFQVSVEMKPTAYEKQVIENQINIAMQEGLLNFADAFAVRQIKNNKLAQIFLSQTTEKNKKDQAQQAKQQMQLQAQLTSQGETAKAQQNAEIEMSTMQAKADIESKGKTAEKELAVINGLFNVYAKHGALPDELKPLAAQMIANVSMPVMAENQVMKQGLQKMAQVQQQQQDQQMQQEQAQPQKGAPPPDQQPDPSQQEPDQSQPPQNNQPQ